MWHDRIIASNKKCSVKKRVIFFPVCLCTKEGMSNLVKLYFLHAVSSNLLSFCEVIFQF